MTAPALPSTIASPVEHQWVVKKSVFVTHLAPVATMDEADAVIARIRKERWDARHHCTAMVLGPRADRQRSSDDGEPSGTAGVPMLEVLRHREVTDVVAVVSRWFGGVLLGSGGLVRAYTAAVAQTLDIAPLVRRRVMTRVTIEGDHSQAGRLVAFCHSWVAARGGILEDTRYGELAVITLLVPPADLDSLAADLAAFTGGATVPQRGPSIVADLPA